jgi:putative transposase
VLQQSIADLHRAYRNYFRALSAAKAERARGHKTKLRVRKPRLKRKRGEQAARFTANSRFRVRPNGRLSLPKIGDVAVRWSQALPASPSSVTVTLDCSGRYHASFVVEVARQPLPAVQREVGVDLGLHVLAALSNGTTVANPRWLRQAELRLRRAIASSAADGRGRPTGTRPSAGSPASMPTLPTPAETSTTSSPLD